LSSERGRRFFGDGPPNWTQGRNDQPAKTSELAIHERGLLVKALRRDGSAEAVELAGRIDLCRRGQRCLSGACPACARATQRVFVHACRNLFDDNGQDMVVVNVVCHWAGIDRGRLADHEDLFEETRGRLRDALADVAARAVGGFDVSLNTHEADAFEPYWAPHVLIVAPARRLLRLHEDFREWFPAGDETPRPVRMSAFDGAARGFAYALKSDFSQRISLEPRLLADGSRSTFGTRGKPIGGASRVELALAVDRAGLDARLFMRGYELVTSGGRRRDCSILGPAPAAPSPPTVRSAQSDALAKVTEPSMRPAQ
jgi:hypothetical protein